MSLLQIDESCMHAVKKDIDSKILLACGLATYISEATATVLEHLQNLSCACVSEALQLFLSGSKTSSTSSPSTSITTTDYKKPSVTNVCFLHVLTLSETIVAAGSVINVLNETKTSTAAKSLKL